MQTITFTSRIEAPADEVFAWHAQPGAFERLTPPWANVMLESFEGIREGQRAVLRVAAGPVRRRWVAEHHGYIEGRQFCDRQVQGPFAYWNHTHRMEPDGTAACLLTDHIDYRPPGGKLGHLVAGSKMRHELHRMFTYRHCVTQHDLALHRRYNPEARRLRIVVSGASGLVGSYLVSFLRAGGHEVQCLVRRQPAGDGEIYWNHRTGEIEAAKLEEVDAVIHLAGEPVAALRWTQEKKMRILRSREAGTRLIAETVARLEEPPEVFIAASGIAYYGHRKSEVLTEKSSPGKQGFLTAVAREWEEATRATVEAGLRTVRVRMGMVLAAEGGALGLIVPWFRRGLGGHIGTGEQYISWIAPDDVLGAVLHTLMTDLDGPINLTAPEPVPMATFTKTLARVLGRSARLVVPPELIRIVSGEVADELLLTSARVLPDRLQQSGYVFGFADLEQALRHQLGKGWS